MEAKRLSEKELRRMKAEHDVSGITMYQVNDLFSHIAALESENKGLREDAAFTERVLESIRASFLDECGDVVDQAEDSVRCDIAAEQYKAEHSPDGVTR